MRAIPYLHILGSGENEKARANRRGYLFERLMRDLFESLRINVVELNRSESGTEIDITGEHVVGNIPVVAECKARSDPLRSGDIQKFAGKFHLQWMNDNRVVGYIFSLSRFNSKANEFWRELKSHYGDNLVRHTEEEIINLIIDNLNLCSYETIRRNAQEQFQRTAGDTLLVCVESGNERIGLFWAQLLMSTDTTEPSVVAFYTNEGRFVESNSVVRELLTLKPDLDTPGLTCANLETIEASQPALDDVSPSRTVVRVRMSSDWFDYRFPAAPEFFVGREYELNEIIRFIAEVRAGRTTSRGIFISGKSGIGKSSLALKAREELRDENVIFLPIDSRLCDDISFLYDTVNELLFELRREPSFREHLLETRVRGLDSLIETLSDIDRALAQNGALAVLFLDQFEKVFDYPEVTNAVRTLFLQTTERQLDILFGFAWKSDLWSQTEGFPHGPRDDIVRETQAIRSLREFGEQETSEILRELEHQWGSRLSFVVHRQLATFSRGLPWLLKKVCSHVLAQQEQGITEEELIETNLNLRDLFEADLSGLDEEERSLLRSLAPLLPATLRKLSESFEISNIDESLHRFIDKRILVKITEEVPGGSYGNIKYDAYSDIFREYLVTGTVPLQDAYYFFTYPRGAFRFFNKVRERGSLSIQDEMTETGKQIGSIYNLSRDLRELGLVEINDGVFTVSEQVRKLDSEGIVSYLQGRLKNNRVVSLTLGELNENETVSLDRIAELLKELFPSVKATEKTWMHYSRITAHWLHEARLAFYSRRESSVNKVENEEIFERVATHRERSTGYNLPVRFRNAVIAGLEAMYEHGGGKARESQLSQWLKKKPGTVQMILSDNINLGFIKQGTEPQTYELTAAGREFIVSLSSQRRKLFRQRCMQLQVVSNFVSLVEEAGPEGISSQDAAAQVSYDMGLEIADATIIKLGGILANWTEYAELIARSGRLCFMPQFVPEQMELFQTS